jgi:hypothetical protein
MVSESIVFSLEFALTTVDVTSPRDGNTSDSLAVASKTREPGEEFGNLGPCPTLAGKQTITARPPSAPRKTHQGASNHE